MNKEISMSKEQERVYEWVMSRQQSNACAVYGICYHVADRIAQGDITALVYAINKAIDENRFFKVEESDDKVMGTICHLFYVDPMLIRVMM